MKNKKTSRPAATGNGSINTKLRIILADQKLKNKLHNAILHGSVLGAVVAVFGGVLYMDTSIAAGAVVSVLGIAWLWLFYLVNAEDKIFGGWS